MVGDKALQIIQQADSDNRQKAERMAVDEICSYLRGRYDVKKVFAAVGAERSDIILMYTCDVALYHLISWLPQKMGYEIRKERYDRAIKWLEGVQAGKVIPDLPLLTGENGEDDPGAPIRFSPGQKNTYDW